MTQPTSETPQVRRIGNYEILRKLGRGMSDVYLALDKRQNLRVVLKVIERTGDAINGITIDAERKGAEIQRQLHAIDSRILAVHEVEERDGCFFVAMEYFEGVTIAQLLHAENRLDPVRAARYATEVLAQLQVLHVFFSDVHGRRRPVVHGDVKPSNIQLGAGGAVRLLDFGIARVIGGAQGATRNELGSPVYCSPERLARGQVDPQSDLWSLAVTLYEMVSGTAPYEAANTRKLEALIQSRRPPRALPQDCPARLRAILFKALAADVTRRYATAAEFSADLQAFIEGRDTVAEREKLPSWEAAETIRTEAPPTRRVAPASAFPGLRLGHVRLGFFRFGQWVGSDLRKWLARAGPLRLRLALPLLLLLPAAALSYRIASDTRPLRDVSVKQLSSTAQIEAEWRVYQTTSRRYGFLSGFSPVVRLRPSLHASFMAAGTAVIDGYRNSSDPDLANFDWTRARLAFTHALELDPADGEARGLVALCDGYLSLARNPRPPDAQKVEALFFTAAADLARSPDAHLGLARLYVYGFRNVGLAMGQFQEAERRGFRPGPRELEQQADGFLYRAEFELGRARRAAGSATPSDAARWLKQSGDDLNRARDTYAPLYGFSRVGASLDQLEKDREAVLAVKDATDAMARPKAPAAYANRSRRAAPPSSASSYPRRSPAYGRYQ